MTSDPLSNANPSQDRPLGHLLFSVFNQLSNKIAGGIRQTPQDLLPGAGDPLEGSIPDEYLPQVDTMDWFDPTPWDNADPNVVSSMDLAAMQPATGEGHDGKGLDWFRRGEAPSNATNRNNPLYVARKEFAVAIAPKVEDLFGVSAHGSAGYYRPPAPSDAEPGGRSPNSDHYSAGAVDFFGEKADLTNLRNWLVTQPWVSFVRWESESHYDHLHMSIDIGWIAQNYYQDRVAPSISGQSAPSAQAMTQKSNPQPQVETSPVVRGNDQMRAV